ncbi:XRE family transcriptional regulator [Alloscardovia criceti]|uniref:XRE family transcriptional regulator n=1 Tax=Alloscardovia criceti TaxID=356828 RepID=UPI00389957C0
MTVQYMSLTEVAEFLGITKGALPTLKLPDSDVRVGKTRGWKKPSKNGMRSVRGVATIPKGSKNFL